jgi:hypothetical protein
LAQFPSVPEFTHVAEFPGLALSRAYMTGMVTISINHRGSLSSDRGMLAKPVERDERGGYTLLLDDKRSIA